MSSTFQSNNPLRVSAVFTVGTEAADVINVAVQFKDRDNGNELGSRVAIPMYLSDDANGDSVAGTAPSGGIAIGTDGLFIEWTADKAGLAVSESDGDFDIDITEAGADTWYLVAVMPDGSLEVSAAITFAA